MTALRPDVLAGRVAFIAGGTSGYVGAERDPVRVQEVMEQAHATFDIVVSGAAGNARCPAERLSSNSFRAVVHLDLLGPFHVPRTAYTCARTLGASFLNIVAPPSTEAYWGRSHGSAATAGVDLPTRSLADVNGSIVFCDGGRVLAGGRDYRAGWLATPAAASDG